MFVAGYLTGMLITGAAVLFAKGVWRANAQADG